MRVATNGKQRKARCLMKIKWIFTDRDSVCCRQKRISFKPFILAAVQRGQANVETRSFYLQFACILRPWRYLVADIEVQNQFICTPLIHTHTHTLAHTHTVTFFPFRPILWFMNQSKVCYLIDIFDYLACYGRCWGVTQKRIFWFETRLLESKRKLLLEHECRLRVRSSWE